MRRARQKAEPIYSASTSPGSFFFQAVTTNPSSPLPERRYSYPTGRGIRVVPGAAGI